MRSITPLAAMLFIVFSRAQSREIGLGTVELSGQGSYTMSGGNGYSNTALMLSPSAAVYLSRYFNLGPVFSWERYHAEEPDISFNNGAGYSSTNTFLSVGGKLGFLVNYSDMIGLPLPFFDLSAGPEWVSSSYTGGSSESRMGELITGTVGAKFKLSESFLIAAFFSLADHTLEKYQVVNTFGFGFSGLI